MPKPTLSFNLTHAMAKLLRQNFAVQHLTITNQSEKHKNHQHVKTLQQQQNFMFGQSHFDILLVSDDFINLPRVQRHQKVYAVLANMLNGKQANVHALALHCFTNDEYNIIDEKLASANCS